MQWPSLSPDLNPIENMWALVKRALHQDGTRDKSKGQIYREFAKKWNEISPTTTRRLVELMPCRVRAVIRARGGHTKY